MSDFGKLNFSVALNPTSAFPLDARCYFESLVDAEAAAATAEAAGSTNTVYYYGQKLVVVDGDTATWYTIQPDKTLKVDGTGSGSQGKSAYEVAVDNGFEGTVTEWLASLKGDDYLLTDSDKSDIAEAVIGLLPRWQGGSY